MGLLGQGVPFTTLESCQAAVCYFCLTAHTGYSFYKVLNWMPHMTWQMYTLLNDFTSLKRCFCQIRPFLCMIAHYFITNMLCMHCAKQTPKKGLRSFTKSKTTGCYHTKQFPNWFISWRFIVFPELQLSTLKCVWPLTAGWRGLFS